MVVGGRFLHTGGVDPAGQPGLPASRGALVQDALRRGAVQVTRRGPEEILGSLVGALDRHRNLLGVGLEGRPDRLVPDAMTLVLAVPLDLGLDVGHGGRLYQRPLVAPGDGRVP